MTLDSQTSDIFCLFSSKWTSPSSPISTLNSKFIFFFFYSPHDFQVTCKNRSLTLKKIWSSGLSHHPIGTLSAKYEPHTWSFRWTASLWFLSKVALEIEDVVVKDRGSFIFF
jgi:hypothetical protein